MFIIFSGVWQDCSLDRLRRESCKLWEPNRSVTPVILACIMRCPKKAYLLYANTLMCMLKCHNNSDTGKLYSYRSEAKVSKRCLVTWAPNLAIWVCPDPNLTKCPEAVAKQGYPFIQKRLRRKGTAAGSCLLHLHPP